MTNGPGGAWTYLPTPFNVSQFLGLKARFSVAETINGFSHLVEISARRSG